MEVGQEPSVLKKVKWIASKIGKPEVDLFAQDKQQGDTVCLTISRPQIDRNGCHGIRLEQMEDNLSISSNANDFCGFGETEIIQGKSSAASLQLLLHKERHYNGKDSISSTSPEPNLFPNCTREDYTKYLLKHTCKPHGFSHELPQK